MAVAAWAAPSVASALQAPLPQAAAPEDAWHLCTDTAHQIERREQLPETILEAITTVETGRAAPGESIVRPWPWTVTAEGKGAYYPSKKEAILAVRALLARGIESVDVGCMQVNLHFHPGAFTSLEEAFDPSSNMTYATALLKQLKSAQGSWESAIEHYHSYDPGRRLTYRIKVFASWQNIGHERDAFRLASEVSSEPLGAIGRAVRLETSAREVPVTGAIDTRHRGASILGGPVVKLANLDPAEADADEPAHPSPMVIIAVDLRPQPSDRPDPTQASVLGRTTVAVAEPSGAHARD